MIIGMNGMRTNTELDALEFTGMVRWLAALDALQLYAQASQRAAASRRTPREVLTAWTACGYIAAQRVQEACQAACSLAHEQVA